MFLFEDAHKERLRRQLWQAAEFSGVEILTYCLLSNHFHVLVRVPAAAEISDPELVRRYRILYPKRTRFTGEHGGVVAGPDISVEDILRTGGSDAEKLRTAIRRRMGDVSQFMKTVKQRFSVWFNKAHRRDGTLWAERFKSVLVEPKAHAVLTVAAYIDLNAVRAGLVKDPKDYRFCGYAEALGSGHERIRAGLNSVLESKDWRQTLRDYRGVLFGKGAEAKADGSPSGVIDPAAATEVLNNGGRLPLPTVLRCRVRYFTDGAALGAEQFVSTALHRYQRQTGRRRKQTAPRPLAGADWSGLTSLRGLRRAVFG
jgi:hypothetical protein